MKIRNIILIILILNFVWYVNLHASLSMGAGIAYSPLNQTEIQYDYEFEFYYYFLSINKIKTGLGLLHFYRNKEIDNNERELLWGLPIVASIYYPLFLINKNWKLNSILNLGASWTKLGARYSDDIYYLRSIYWSPYIDLGVQLAYEFKRKSKNNQVYIKTGIRYISPDDIEQYRSLDNDASFNLISPMIMIGLNLGI